MKGKTGYIFAMMCCLVCYSSEGNAQVLYEVSGNSAQGKSYILATNKLADVAFLDTIPSVFKCYGRCDKVITEFAMQDYEAIAALRQAAILPDSVRLMNFYSDQEYKEINDALLITLGMGLDKLGRMKPSYLTEMYRNELLKRWLATMTSVRWRHFLSASHRKAARPCTGWMT